MTQLVQPNLSAVGRIGWCLEYQARVWGTSHNEPTAWVAWGRVNQRTDTPPADVAYPLWFSYYQNGVNLGHVVAYVPGAGYYSSPWKSGTTHAILPSISEVERIYGVKYVGWSEDILNEQVIGEAMKQSIDPELVWEHYINYTGVDVGKGSPATQNRFENGQDDEFWYGLVPMMNGIRLSLVQQVADLSQTNKDLQAKIDAGGGQYTAAPPLFIKKG